MRIVGIGLLLFGIAASALAGLPQRGAADQAPDAETHKQWMNNAADLQEDLREAIAAKDGKRVDGAATKIEGLLALTEEYWAAKKQSDIVKLAQESRAHAREISSDAAAGKLDAAAQAFERMNVTCNACHDLHPERR